MSGTRRRIFFLCAAHPYTYCMNLYRNIKIVFNSRNIWYSFDEFQFPSSHLLTVTSSYSWVNSVASLDDDDRNEDVVKKLQYESAVNSKKNESKRIQYIILNRFCHLLLQVLIFYHYWNNRCMKQSIFWYCLH